MDKINTPPTTVGPYGRFWETDRVAYRKNFPEQCTEDTTVAAFIIEAPWAHPMWHSYMLAAGHLRDVPGVKPAHISLPGATHEMWLFALNPEYPREPVIAGTGHMRFLQPLNFVAQFIATSDGMARERMLKTAEEIIDGKLSPDTDYIKWWAERFGTNSLKPGWDRGTTIILPGTEIVIPPRPTKSEMN